MITTQEDLSNRIKSMFSENPTDEQISLMEDFADTMNSMSAEGQSDLQAKLDEAEKKASEWEQKYTDNDSAWRKRYVDRFNGKSVEEIPEVKSQLEADKSANITIDDLFTTH